MTVFKGYMKVDQTEQMADTYVCGNLFLPARF